MLVKSNSTGTAKWAVRVQQPAGAELPSRSHLQLTVPFTVEEQPASNAGDYVSSIPFWLPPH